jgi:cytochrome b561
MQIKNSPARYGAAAQFIHWLTALLVICGWLLGQFGDDLPKGPARAFGLYLHMTFGQWVIALLIVRLAWRFANPPPLPEATPLGRLLEIAAKVSHFALYALLFVVPFLGIIVQLKRGRDLPLIGIWNVVSPWPADRPLARTILTAHEYLADALLILAGVHACAALVHHYVWRDRTLACMLPRARQ